MNPGDVKAGLNSGTVRAVFWHGDFSVVDFGRGWFNGRRSLMS